MLKSTKLINMVMKLPEIHAKGFEILEKFFHANGSRMQIHLESHSQSNIAPPPFPVGIDVLLLQFCHQKAIKRLVATMRQESDWVTLFCSALHRFLALYEVNILWQPI